MGDGARALVSIVALLPQVDEDVDKESRQKDLSYYMSRDVDDAKTEERTSGTNKDEQQSEQDLNAAAVSHTCCALVNTDSL